MKPNDLNEESLDFILGMPNTERIVYISSILKQHYPQIEEGSERFIQLLNAYEATLIIEKIYRNNVTIHNFFTPVYDQAGIIRELANDMYLSEESLYIH